MWRECVSDRGNTARAREHRASTSSDACSTDISLRRGLRRLNATPAPVLLLQPSAPPVPWPQHLQGGTCDVACLLLTGFGACGEGVSEALFPSPSVNLQRLNEWAWRLSMPPKTTQVWQQTQQRTTLFFSCSPSCPAPAISAPASSSPVAAPGCSASASPSRACCVSPSRSSSFAPSPCSSCRRPSASS